MKIIKELEEYIADEIDGAREYAEMALKSKETEPAMAKVFFDMANAKLIHMDNLHKLIVAKIEEYRKEHGEPPIAMQAIYDREHEKQISEVAEIKIMLAMYSK